MPSRTENLSGRGVIREGDEMVAECTYDLSRAQPLDGGPGTTTGSVIIWEQVQLEPTKIYTLELENGAEQDFFTGDDPALQFGSSLPWVYSITPAGQWRLSKSE
jgi:hypothetical protein